MTGRPSRLLKVAEAKPRLVNFLDSHACSARFCHYPHMRNRGIVLMLTLGVAALVSGCGQQTTPAERLSCSEYTQYSASMSLEGGGQPTAIAAAEKFSETGAASFPVPSSGWVTVGPTTGSSVTVRSGDVQLSTIQAKDGTWLVESAKACK